MSFPNHPAELPAVSDRPSAGTGIRWAGGAAAAVVAGPAMPGYRPAARCAGMPLFAPRPLPGDLRGLF